MSVLSELVEHSRRELDERRRALPLAELESQLRGPREDRPFSEALVSGDLAVIAEFKRRSPSAGELRPGADAAAMARAYERGGASALSVLTQGADFGGSLDDLRAARAATELPILRKDFTVDPYQLYEAAVAGADAVLLVVAALGREQLWSLMDVAEGLDLDCLVEVHSEDELKTALEAEADVIGINNRDLTDLSVDVQRTFELLSDIPAGKTVVSESGIAGREQLDELARVGVDAVLIGEALMRAPDPEAACRELVPAEDSTEA